MGAGSSCVGPSSPARPRRDRMNPRSRAAICPPMVPPVSLSGPRGDLRDIWKPPHSRVLPVRQHRDQRRDDGQRAAHPVPRPALRADADPVHLHGRAGPRGGGPARRGDGGPGAPRWCSPPPRWTRSARSCCKTKAPIIDFFGIHMSRVEEQLGARGLHEARRLHGVGDVRRYNSRMAAIEFAIEHDDGLSPRGLDRADVILLAPSRCGKTPDRDVPGAAARPVRGQLPARRRGPGDHRPAPPGPRPGATAASG